MWVASAVLAVAFFGIEHLLFASTYDDYAPSQEAMEGANTTADPLRRFGLFGLLGLGVWGLKTGTAARWRWGHVAGWTVAAWFLWLAVSTFWSTDPRTTFRRVIVLFGFTLCACGLCKRLNGRQIAAVAAGSVGLQLAFGFLVELGLRTFRPWSGEYRFAGTIHPNIQALQLSAGCVAAAALAAFGRDWTTRVRWLAAAAALFAFLFLTKSRTSTGGALLAVLGVLALSVPPKWKKAGLIPAALLGSAGAMVLLFGGFDPSKEIEQAAMMGRNEQQTSLSGRLPIWEALDPYVAKKRWKGWGYQCFWTKEHVDALTTDVDFKFSGAHSAWYESRLDGGLVGMGLMAATLLFGLLRAGRLFLFRRGPVPAYAFGVVTCAAVNSLLEALICDVRLFPLLMLCGILKITFLPDAEPDAPGETADRPPAGAAVPVSPAGPPATARPARISAAAAAG